MLARLHRRYDALPARWQAPATLAVVLPLVAALAQPWSKPLVLAATFALAALLASRIRHVEAR